ncbi:MAG: hypothetical protein JSW60_05130 [Thermoplasmatales archaeon]|nr:MAG: hypothetical protein JSW60_05130 [Thermoplasmatales archaeon]
MQVKVEIKGLVVSKGITVLPAFSPLATGTVIISAEKSDYLSPVIQKKPMSVALKYLERAKSAC